MKTYKGKPIRWHALLSLILSTISFILGVVTIFSGSKNGVLEDYYFLRLKTANLGQSLVQFAAVNSTTANTTSIIDISALNSRDLSSDSIEKRDAASDFATALFGNVIKEVKSIAKKIEAGDNDGLNEAEKALVSNITDTVGVADFYSLHVIKICRGTITSEDKWVVDGCSNYSQALKGLTQLTSSTPSTFRIVNTTLTVPFLGLATTAMPFTAGMLNIGTMAILALYGLALIGSGATIFLSAIYMFKPTARIVYCALFFSFLASNFTMTVTLNLTAVTSMVSQMVSLVGPALGVEASVGGAFLGSSWIAAIFALIFNQYWMMVWLVEIRGYGFRRRIRTDEEIGDWKGIMNELKRDWKKPVPEGLTASESNENLMVIERVDEVTGVSTKDHSYRLG
ncbi:hypothetical protein BCIN_03g03500 [Botrytis cinerea B05.10]|uniref:Sur7 protein n=1 Tax=Botryotinia fuckeliana (strain B05.10) TaxID=332648 RepID=A0A384JCB3_BOTFB|nr:hypothetical protein BCIN_03g03500 [Botrytis cinerea B05.10]ATZ48102.1 hypothetical protein BCIN_03g03500 [Botrytis cinerea B05.10]